VSYSYNVENNLENFHHRI